MNAKYDVEVWGIDSPYVKYTPWFKHVDVFDLALMLNKDLKDVIVIDKNEDSFRKLSDSFGGLTYVNEGTRVETYEQLELKKDDILIVVTNDDNVKDRKSVV